MAFASGSGINAARGSWWCSNGLYHLVTDASNQTDNVVQTLPDNANQRMELALVGCPQLSATCGKALADTDANASGSNVLVIALKVATLTTKDKCTFVAYGVKYPPAFSIAKATGSGGSAGIVAASSWTIHHMEYTDGQLTAQAALNYNTGLESIDNGSKVPQFNMPWAEYNKQRTWYGATPTSGQPVTNHMNWSSPYSNGAAAGATGLTGGQQFGSVAIFASSVAGTDYSDGSGNATFDQRAVRYLPMQVAMNDNAMGTAVATLYNTKKTAYDSAKTMWNNYVAILTKNSKVDAFAAAFAPPKAPTVPPLPNMPWLPDVSATLSQLSAQNQASAMTFAGVATINKALQPKTNEFWLVDDSVPLQTGGGWGSFTAAVIKYRDGWGKSFGTIGYEKVSGTTYAEKGAVYKQAW